jgi:8-oxo-dGTP diphosphatase
MRGTPAPANSVDIVLCTLHERQLAVLLLRDPSRRARWNLPWAPLAGTSSLDDTAAQLAHRAAGTRAHWLAQAGAFSDASGHPGASALAVTYVGVMPHPEGGPPVGAKWFPVGDLPPVPALAARHREELGAALAQLRERLDREPIAFRLLDTTFTLGELQAVYELLLARRLHKASFRRALQAAFLVEPTDEWRSEGRGRPAQLFRYAPRRRHGVRGGVRFELLGG